MKEVKRKLSEYVTNRQRLSEEGSIASNASIPVVSSSGGGGFLPPVPSGGAAIAGEWIGASQKLFKGDQFGGSLNLDLQQAILLLGGFGFRLCLASCSLPHALIIH